MIQPSNYESVQPSSLETMQIQIDDLINKIKQSKQKPKECDEYIRQLVSLKTDPEKLKSHVKAQLKPEHGDAYKKFKSMMKTEQKGHEQFKRSAEHGSPQSLSQHRATPNPETKIKEIPAIGRESANEPVSSPQPQVDHISSLPFNVLLMIIDKVGWTDPSFYEQETTPGKSIPTFLDAMTVNKRFLNAIRAHPKLGLLLLLINMESNPSTGKKG